jgi:hypothetical protein
MAHSYIYAKKSNSSTERRVAIPYGALHLFMYFFNEVVRSEVGLNNSEICEHYRIELLEVHTSYIDALLQEISENKPLCNWYLLMLSKLELRIEKFGEFIDNEYLNQIPELLVGYTSSVVFLNPIPVSTLNNLINDIYWVLNEGERTPSGQYKWFEENI